MTTPELLTVVAFCVLGYALGRLRQLAQCRAHRGEDMSARMRRRAAKQLTESPYEQERRRLALERISEGTTHDAPTGIRIITKEEGLYVYWAGQPTSLVPGTAEEGVPDDIAHALSVALMSALNVNFGEEKP